MKRTVNILGVLILALLFLVAISGIQRKHAQKNSESKDSTEVRVMSESGVSVNDLSQPN